MLTPIGIVAHGSRYQRAARLADWLGAEVVCVDQDGKLGAGKNHEMCYEYLSHYSSPWSVIMEDDAIPVRSFREQLPLVLGSVPESSSVVSLYLGRSRPPHYQPSIAQVIARDENFLLCDELLHHVAVAVRTPLIPSILDYINNDWKYLNGRLPIDEAIGRFCRSAGMKVAYTHPSIVNHDSSLPTTIPKHLSQHSADNGKRTSGHPRKAWAFGVRDSWDSSVAVIPEPLLKTNPVAASMRRNKG